MKASIRTSRSGDVGGYSSKIRNNAEGRHCFLVLGVLMMLRTLVALSFPVCMAACTTVPDWPDLLLKKRDDAPLAHYRFDWQLSGDRAVAPLQVFDDGHR